MSKGLLDRIFDSVFDEEWIGRRGEKLTERELKLVNLLGRKGKTLRNLYVPKDNGETSEIDLVYITQKGIFVFESKNYSGWIFGDEANGFWTVSLPNGQKNRFYNPIKQNKTHIKWLQRFVGDQVPLFSIIVFSERCELKKISLKSPDVYVIQRDDTYRTVRRIWESCEDALTEEEVCALYDKLKPITDAEEAVKAAHVETIEKKYKVPNKQEPIERQPEERKPETEANSAGTKAFICPNCGKPMILRTAKKGANVGKQFYGCSGYPQCRYIQQL